MPRAGCQVPRPTCAVPYNSPYLSYVYIYTQLTATSNTLRMSQGRGEGGTGVDRVTDQRFIYMIWVAYCCTSEVQLFAALPGYSRNRTAVYHASRNTAGCLTRFHLFHTWDYSVVQQYSVEHTTWYTQQYRRYTTRTCVTKKAVYIKRRKWCLQQYIHTVCSRPGARKAVQELAKRTAVSPVIEWSGAMFPLPLYSRCCCVCIGCHTSKLDRMDRVRRARESDWRTTVQQ